MKLIYILPFFILPFLNCNNDYSGVQTSKDIGDIRLILGSVTMSWSGVYQQFNSSIFPSNTYDNLEIYHTLGSKIVIRNLHDSLCVTADVDSNYISFNQTTDLYPEDLGFDYAVADWLPITIEGEGEIESFNGKKSKLTLTYRFVHFSGILATFSGSQELLLPRPYWSSGPC